MQKEAIVQYEISIHVHTTSGGPKKTQKVCIFIRGLSLMGYLAILNEVLNGHSHVVVEKKYARAYTKPLSYKLSLCSNYVFSMTICTPTTKILKDTTRLINKMEYLYLVIEI